MPSAIFDKNILYCTFWKELISFCACLFGTFVVVRITVAVQYVRCSVSHIGRCFLVDCSQFGLFSLHFASLANAHQLQV